MPSISIPKLLLKRSSIKQSSTTAQSTRPNPLLSITDINTSSNNTIATDHFFSTHSTISDHEEIISLKKTNKENGIKDRIMETLDSISKRKMIRKTLRPLHNQSLTSPNLKEQHTETSKKKFTNNSLLTNSDLVYGTEPGSDAWMQSHEDIRQILIIDKQNEKKPQAHERHIQILSLLYLLFCIAKILFR